MVSRTPASRVSSCTASCDANWSNFDQLNWSKFKLVKFDAWGTPRERTRMGPSQDRDAVWFIPKRVWE